ncbi:hypothetical protein BREVNS_0855 [Brevinematales bacterium NS]|nr:hypothetical protein [Brevinematales bacterium]QJR21605.1 hypothetical protein BREVNS_0855 [Brevinematales bacterium NS]
MQKSWFFGLLVMVLLLVSQNKGLDYSDPVLVVDAACIFLMKGDYEYLLLLTEENEKKKTLMILSNLQSNKNAKAWLKEEMEKLGGYEIVQAEMYTNGAVQYAVVTTRWLIKNTAKEVSEFATPEERAKIKPSIVMSVDYLLKKIDGKWKIVSTKTRQ